MWQDNKLTYSGIGVYLQSKSESESSSDAGKSSSYDDSILKAGFHSDGVVVGVIIRSVKR